MYRKEIGRMSLTYTSDEIKNYLNNMHNRLCNSKTKLVYKKIEIRILHLPIFILLQRV